MGLRDSHWEIMLLVQGSRVVEKTWDYALVISMNVLAYWSHVLCTVYLDVVRYLCPLTSQGIIALTINNYDHNPYWDSRIEAIVHVRRCISPFYSGMLVVS